MPASDTDVTGFGPVSYHKLFGGNNGLVKTRIILVLGVGEELCDLVNGRLCTEIAFMNASGRFTPSLILLKWLSSTTIGLAFAGQMSSEKYGIVVLRSRPLTPEDLDELGVKELRNGKEASDVWTR